MSTNLSTYLTRALERKIDMPALSRTLLSQATSWSPAATLMAVVTVFPDALSVEEIASKANLTHRSKLALAMGCRRLSEDGLLNVTRLIAQESGAEVLTYELTPSALTICCVAMVNLLQVKFSTQPHVSAYEAFDEAYSDWQRRRIQPQEPDNTNPESRAQASRRVPNSIFDVGDRAEIIQTRIAAPDRPYRRRKQEA